MWVDFGESAGLFRQWEGAGVDGRWKDDVVTVPNSH